VTDPSPLTLEELRRRVAAAAAQLAEESPSNREALRTEILSLFRDTEGLIEELQTLKAEIRPLAERYRALFPAPLDGTPLVHVDHLGSSTFRERGWSALAGGDAARARRELERALELAPGEPASTVLLAWALLKLGEIRSAETHLRRVLRRDPDNEMARVVLGCLQLRQGAPGEAAETLSSFVSSGTDRTALMYGYLYLGVAHEERGSSRQAQGCFRRALELGPNLIEAYLRLGHSHEREGRHELAMEAWKAGADDRFGPWGERCREAIGRLDGDVTSG